MTQPEHTVLVSKQKLCFVIILSMMLQAAATFWGVTHAHGGAAMAQAEEARHSVLTAVSEDHGHSHEDGESDERKPGHLHDHNPFDHSHETPSMSSGLGVTSPTVFSERIQGNAFLAHTGPPEQIDRPPKSM
jgi:hypothetical protein